MTAIHAKPWRRPARAIAVAFLAAAISILTLWQAAAFVGWMGFAGRLREAVTADPGAVFTNSSISFRFQDAECTVTVPVGANELSAAAAIDTSRVFDSRGWIRARYVSTLINTEARSSTVRAITHETRRIRAELNLGHDEYLELLTRFVQVIPYGEPAPEIMLPSQVLAFGQGVCTEKSVLLGALMRREGYDTVVWVFDSQAHVGLGVASDAAGFRGTDYAFIETTEQRYIGEAAKACWSAGPNALPPQMIRLGGSRRYKSGAQVAYILRCLDEAKGRARALQPYARYASTAMRWRERYGQLAEERDRADRLASYLEENSHDRPGVYAVLTHSAAELVRARHRPVSTP